MFDNLAGIFHVGRMQATEDGTDAGVLLKQINKILVDARGAVESHKRYLSSEEYTRLITSHETYHLELMDESQQHRAFEAVQRSPILSRVYPNCRPRHTVIARLHAVVELYQLDVVTKAFAYLQTTSREAREAASSLPAFPDEAASPEGASNSQMSNFFRGWFFPSEGGLTSSGTSSSGSTTVNGSTTVQTSPSALTGAGRYLVGVTSLIGDTGGANPTSSTADSQVFSRVVSLLGPGGRIDVVDPTIYHPDDIDQESSDARLLEMSDLARQTARQREAIGYRAQPLVVDRPENSVETATRSLGAMSINVAA
ncbi:hypothetical protein FRC07_010119 [Ceratobasidium sp. 392]|nr:hypothetical protein FRC07_010119 [Ceratobasidium sp. 392]